MKIKYLNLVIVLIAFFSINKVKAQILDQSRLCVEVGGTLSKISDYGPDSEALISYRVGVTGSMPINIYNFEIGTGLLLTQKGEYWNEGETKANPTYLVVPLDLIYRVDIDENGAFYVNAGPYMGIGVIAGRDKGLSFAKNERFNRFEFGLGLNGSVEYNNFIARVGGEIGLTSPIRNNDDPRNYQVYMTLGYRLFNW